MKTIHNLEQEYGVNQILESFLRNGYPPSRKSGPRSSTNAMNILFQGIRHGVVDDLGRKQKIILIPELLSEVKKGLFRPDLQAQGKSIHVNIFYRFDAHNI